LKIAPFLDRLRGYLIESMPGDAEGDAHMERCHDRRKAQP
jgi:hypothetical protein